MRQKQVEGESDPAQTADSTRTKHPQVWSGLAARGWNIRTGRSLIGALLPLQTRAGSQGAHVTDA